jgi:GWxTD domain-containing protein
MPQFRSAILAITMVISSCSGSESTNVDRGSGYTFRQGYPELRVTAVGYYDGQDAPVIQIVTDVVKSSLIYRSQADTFFASGTLSMQIVPDGASIGRSMVQDIVSIDIRSIDPGVRHSGEVHTITRDVPVIPGKYTVIVSLEDNTSKQNSAVRTLIEIPDPTLGAWGSTGIRVYDHDQVVTTYDVPARSPRIRFVSHVIAPSDIDTVEVEADLIRFDSDQEPARQMAGLPISPGSIEFKGIDQFRPRTVNRTRIRLPNTGRPLFVSVEHDMPEAGSYRMEMRFPQSVTEGLTRAREFSVKSPNYPNLRTVRELAEPLRYLMTQREHRDLIRIQNPDSLKNRMDSFWLKNIRSRVRAARVISHYYTRVEEANKYFSNFKDGWKTDMGMIYILFGPPWYVEESLEYQVWFYSYNRNDPRTVFTFYRPKIQNAYFPFAHYILVRDRNYHSVEYQQVQNWLSGDILDQR